MALIILLKVMVALSVLLCYGASVLRFVNEYFYSQFRSQLEAEYRQHPEMRNLDLDGFHRATQFPGDDKSNADGKSDIFVVDSTTTSIKQQERRSSLNEISLESSGGSNSDDAFDNLKTRNDDHDDDDDSESSIEYNKREREYRGGKRERKIENTFSSSESSDPDHYYSILRPSQSGGHGRDQKPQSDFTAASATHVNSEWISMSISRGKEMEVKDNIIAVEFTTEANPPEEEEEEEADYHQKFYGAPYPTSSDDDYNNNGEEYDAGTDRGGNPDHHSSFNHYYYDHSESSCGGPAATSSSPVDLWKEYDPNVLWNGDGYYCSAGESTGVTNHFESDYYYYYEKKEFQAHQSDDVYEEFHKIVRESNQDGQNMPLNTENGETHYYEDSSPHYPSPTSESKQSFLRDNVMDSSSSILLSKTSSFFNFLLLNLAAVKML